MMHKKPTSGWMRLAYVALLPLLAGTMFLCNPARAEIRPVSSETVTVAEMPAISETPVVTETPVVAETPVAQNPPSEEGPIPFSMVEVKPSFQGGDANTFSKWVSANLVYPEEEKNAEHQGRVMVQFVVNTDGSVSDVKVMRSTGYEALDQEAVRVISSSPKWEPGKRKGMDVPVSYMFPVIFQVRGEKDKPVTVSASTEPKNPGILIRNAMGGTPLVFIDGEKYTGSLDDLNPNNFESITVIKNEEAIEKYGDEAKNGVLVITTKKQ
jgi:TonB family protein